MKSPKKGYNKTMKNKEIDITNGPISSGLLIFTIPIVLTGILQLLYNAADIVVVGRFAGSNSLAAVGSTSSLINLLLNLFIGLSSGAAVCVAHFIGSREKEAVHRSVHTSICLSIIGGFALMLIGIPLSKAMLSMMETPPEIIDEAALYMKIIFIGMPVSLLYNFGAAILRASGNTKTPLIILSCSGLVNIGLNLVFVIVFRMGAEGVGLATIISQAVSAVWITIYLMRLDNECRLHLNKLRIYKSILVRILRIGLPAGIQGIIFSISNVIIQSSINTFGADAIAGSAAAANVEGFCYIAMNSMHQSAITYVGQNVGANRMDRVKKLIPVSCIQVTAIGIFVGSLLLVFAHPVLNLYAPGKENVINYGILRLKYIVPLYFTCGIMETLVGALRGMGTSFLPMIASILGVCGIRILWIFTVFRQHHTLETLFTSYPVSWISTALIQLIFTIIVFKRLNRFNNTSE